MFRMTNNRFDIIGGALYFMLVVSASALGRRGWCLVLSLAWCMPGCGWEAAPVAVAWPQARSHCGPCVQVSVLPRCSGVAEILDAGTVLEGIALFERAAWDTGACCAAPDVAAGMS